MAKVLVVDDDPITRRMIIGFLEQGGYGVLEAENGADALATLDEEPEVRLVFADVDIARVDGLALLEIVRRHHPGTLVVLTTAHPSVEGAITAMKAGAYDYLTKPLSLGWLERVVQSALGVETTISST